MMGGQIVVLADCTALALRMGWAHRVTHGPNGDLQVIRDVLLLYSAAGAQEIGYINYLSYP